MKPLIPLTLFLIVTFATNPVQPAENTGEIFDQARDLQPNLENGRRIFRYCVECHGPEAWGDLEKEAPQTAGQHASVIIKQLRDIHTGLREVTPMIPFADPNLLGGAQGIADIAGFLNRLPMTPTPEQGDGKQVAYGGSLYKTYCARSCHGKAGEGNAATRKPRIQGQHYTYLLRQLKHIRDGVRRNANKAMVRRLQGMTDDQLAAMADFVSRLSP